MPVRRLLAALRLPIALVLVLGPAQAQPGPPPGQPGDTPAIQAEYSFGVVPQFEQRKLSRVWQPILDELQKRTGLAFRLTGSPKIPVFEEKFLAGEFDFAYMNPYHVLKAHASQGYIPLVRDGAEPLTGVLVVRTDSPVQTVADLDGKEIAFPAPNALGASLLMRAELARLHGIRFAPRYVQTHSSVYLHVALGQTAAGGGVDRTLESQKPELRDQLRVLYRTRPMAPHPITAHPRVPEEHRERVRRSLLDMAATERGRALLAEIPMAQAVPAHMDDYEELTSWGLDAFWVSE